MCKPANFASGITRPHRNSLAQGKPPQLILNDAAIDLKILRVLCPASEGAQRLLTIAALLDGTSRKDAVKIGVRHGSSDPAGKLLVHGLIGSMGILLAGATKVMR